MTLGMVCRRVGWGAKSAAIAEIAAELNLGLDSFAFLDDSPLECAQASSFPDKGLSFPFRAGLGLPFPLWE